MLFCKQAAAFSPFFLKTLPSVDGLALKIETPDKKGACLWVPLERLVHCCWLPCQRSAFKFIWEALDNETVLPPNISSLATCRQVCVPAADSCVYNFPSPLLINGFRACCSPWIDFCSMGWWQVIPAGDSIWALVLIGGSAGHAWGWVKNGWDNRTQALCTKVNHPNKIHRGSQLQFPQLWKLAPNLQEYSTFQITCHTKCPWRCELKIITTSTEMIDYSLDCKMCQ